MRISDWSSDVCSSDLTPETDARSAASVRLRGSSARRVSQEKVSMKMSGEQRIAAARDKVWQALNDPDVLRRCIPGCQSLTKESDTRMVATVETKIGPIGARINGAVELADINAPDSYTLFMEEQAGKVGLRTDERRGGGEGGRSGGVG